MKLLFAMLWVAGAAYLPGQDHSPTDALDLSSDQTAPGTRLNHFGRVDEGVYKGSKPRSDADYRFLQSLNVKYIVDLEVIPWVSGLEKSCAKRYGIELIAVRMNASPVSPSEKHVGTVLALLRDQRCQPIYFHCILGRDRTALIAALYKMYFLGMSPEAAQQYLYDSGYKDGWVRSGLKRYLEKHPTPAPVSLSSTRSRLQCAS
jgi:protein tyrosine/serine phosphatase